MAPFFRHGQDIGGIRHERTSGKLSVLHTSFLTFVVLYGAKPLGIGSASIPLHAWPALVGLSLRGAGVALRHPGHASLNIFYVVLRRVQHKMRVHFPNVCRASKGLNAYCGCSCCCSWYSQPASNNTSRADSVLLLVPSPSKRCFMKERSTHIKKWRTYRQW